MQKIRLITVILVLLTLTLAACNLTAGGNQTLISGVPSVSIASPLPNATYLEGVLVNIQAAVSNAGADIDRVEFSVDGKIITTRTSPNASAAPTFSIAETWTAAGLGTHSIAIVAFRKDGSSNPATTVNITVLAQAPAAASATPMLSLPTLTPSPQAVQPTADSAITQPTSTAQALPPPVIVATVAEATPIPAATATPNVPSATINQGINVRSGPSTLFNPPIGSLAAAQTVEVVAKTAAGDWLKIRYYNDFGWIFAAYTTQSASVATVPIDNGPPLPTLTPVPVVQPTAVPPTAAPASTANLVAGIGRFDPPSPTCLQTFNIYIDVANLGTSNLSNGGLISIEDFSVRDGSSTQKTQGAFGAINAGQTVNVGPIPITVSTYKGEEHRLVIIIDSTGVIPESNEGDNTREMRYTLQNGSC